MKKPRIMHPNHLSEAEREIFNQKVDISYVEAFNWLRDNYHMSVNQAHAFLNDAGVPEDHIQLSPEMAKRIERQIEEIENGTAKLYTMEEIYAKRTDDQKKLIEEARKRLKELKDDN